MNHSIEFNFQIENLESLLHSTHSTTNVKCNDCWSQAHCTQLQFQQLYALDAVHEQTKINGDVAEDMH